MSGEFARVEQRPGPIGTYGVLVVGDEDVSVDERWLEPKAERINAAVAKREAEERRKAIEESLAIYERGFEQNRVVQDVIDEIRQLAGRG